MHRQYGETWLASCQKRLLAVIFDWYGVAPGFSPDPVSSEVNILVGSMVKLAGAVRSVARLA